MTKKIFLNILVIAVLATIIHCSISIIIFGRGQRYDDMTRDDWKKVETMSYGEAREYIKEHSKKMSGFDIFRNRFTSVQLFMHFLKTIFRSSVVNFIIALVVALRVIQLKEIELYKLKNT